MDSSVSEVKTEKDTDIDTIAAGTMVIGSTSQSTILNEKPAHNMNQGNSETGKGIDFPIRRANINKWKMNNATELLTENRGVEILDIDVGHFMNTSTLEENIDKDNDTISASAIVDKPVASTSQSGILKSKKKNDLNINKRKLNNGTEVFTEKRGSGELLDIGRQKVELLEREISVEQNPDLLFFKSLLPYMLEFTPTQKLRIRTKIQNLILAELEATQQGTGETCGGIEMLAPHPQYYRSPSVSSVSADSAHNHISPQPICTNFTPVNFCELTQNSIP